MKEIKLSQGLVALVDDDDYEWLNSFKWCVRKGGNNFYAKTGIRGHGIRAKQDMHKLIMGNNPLKPMIDHKDGNGLNNQRDNLRFCTAQENQMNARPQLNCYSLYKGVSWDKKRKKWVAYIRINRKMINLGGFNLEEDAAKAYDVAAIKHCPEFAKLNFTKHVL